MPETSTCKDTYVSTTNQLLIPQMWLWGRLRCQQTAQWNLIHSNPTDTPRQPHLTAVALRFGNWLPHKPRLKSNWTIQALNVSVRSCQRHLHTRSLLQTVPLQIVLKLRQPLKSTPPYQKLLISFVHLLHAWNFVFPLQIHQWNSTWNHNCSLRPWKLWCRHIELKFRHQKCTLPLLNTSKLGSPHYAPIPSWKPLISEMKPSESWQRTDHRPGQWLRPKVVWDWVLSLLLLTQSPQWDHRSSATMSNMESSLLHHDLSHWIYEYRMNLVSHW